MKKYRAVGMFIFMLLLVCEIATKKVYATNEDRDPMEGGRMSPMEATQEYAGDDLLRSGSNDYISVTGVKGAFL